MNVTEVLVSEFKNAFSGIFNFTVVILIDPTNSKVEKIRNRNWANHISKRGEQNIECPHIFLFFYLQVLVIVDVVFCLVHQFFVNNFTLTMSYGVKR